MISEKKVRVVITLPVEMNEKIETLSDALGMTKSSFIGMCAGEKVMSYYKTFETLDKFASELFSKSDDGQVAGQMDLADVMKHLTAN